MQPQSTSSHPRTLANAVRIEKLSDDENEEIDITDDVSDNEEDKPKRDPCKSEPQEVLITMDDTQPGQEEMGLALTESENMKKEELCGSPTFSDGPSSLELGVSEQKAAPEAVSWQINKEHKFESLERTGQTEEACDEDTGRINLWSNVTMMDAAFVKKQNNVNTIIYFLDKKEESTRPEDSQEEDEEEEELKPPDQEMEMDMKVISEDEKQAIPEFFEGRPSKTPERYLKIRNYILDQWYVTCLSRSFNPAFF